ncbi:MAG: translation initiation factor IF-3 [Deltaproteobacteria bacterium]|nr:translation initiation factor IF-3 [Deltaproteobacteria bacterium]
MRGANINVKKRESDNKRVNVNNYIRSPKVRVINDEGEQLGIMPIAAALEAARAVGLDLVEVAAEADPPVCRIMDFGRYKYQQSKKLSESRKKSTIIEIKEVKFRPKTDEHDYQFKLKNILKFLKDKNKIKVSVIFKGREIAHSHLGYQFVDRLIKDVAEFGLPDSTPKLEGRSIIFVLTPKQTV